jgi:hypothetical protein
MKEPYAVPYVGMSYWQMGVSEKNNTTGASGTYDTDMAPQLRRGF